MIGEHVVSGLRITVDGRSGSIDLVVSAGATVEDVASEYAGRAGLTTVPALVTRSGAALDPDAYLEEAGVTSGALLLVASDAHVGALDDGGATPDAATAPRRYAGSVALVGAVVALLAAVIASVYVDGPLRWVVALVLLAGAVVGLASSGRVAPVPVAPAFAAGAGFCAAYSDRPGGALLAVAVGGLACAVAAAVGEASTTGPREYERSWLVLGGLVAVVAAGLLLLGAGVGALAASLFLLALVVARIIPALVLDVPDTALVDLDRLAVTAWSARDQPRGRRGRSVVARETVDELLLAGQRHVHAAVVAVSAVVLATLPVLTLQEGGLRRPGVLALEVLGGAALVFMAHGHRALVPRRAMRVAGSASLVTAGVSLVLSVPAGLVLAATGAVIAAGLVVVIAAVAVGRGWRSVWWARVGEILEGLCLAFALGAFPFASGLFDAVRGMAS